MIKKLRPDLALRPAGPAPIPAAETKPNEAKQANPNRISTMRRISEKQSQSGYLACFQSVSRRKGRQKGSRLPNVRASMNGAALGAWCYKCNGYVLIPGSPAARGAILVNGNERSWNVHENARLKNMSRKAAASKAARRPGAGRSAVSEPCAAGVRGAPRGGIGRRGAGATIAQDLTPGRGRIFRSTIGEGPSTIVRRGGRRESD